VSLPSLPSWLPSLPGLVWVALAVGVAVVVALVVLVAVYRAARRRRRVAARAARVAAQAAGVAPEVVDRERRVDTVLTLAVALVATAAAANGMWAFLGDVVHVGPLARPFMFFVFEASLLVFALRARRSLLRHRTRGVEGALVWVMAALSGVLASMDVDSVGAALFRLAVPMVAAALWDRGLSLERQDADAVRATPLESIRSRVTWRVSPVRVLVWLRLADATARDVGAVDRSRRIAAMVRAAWRYHDSASVAKPGRIRGAWSSWAAWRLRRLTLAAASRGDLGADGSVAVEVRARLAALYQVVDGTSPKAVAEIDAWAGRSTARRPRVTVAVAAPASIEAVSHVSPVSDPPVPPAPMPETGGGETAQAETPSPLPSVPRGAPRVAQAPAARPMVGSSRQAVIDEALAVLGTGPEVTTPAVVAWLVRERPEVSVGVSTVRARLAAVRAGLAPSAESGAESGAELALSAEGPGAESGAELADRRPLAVVR
jgi:hypothetical protein